MTRTASSPPFAAPSPEDSGEAGEAEHGSGEHPMPTPAPRGVNARPLLRAEDAPSPAEVDAIVDDFVDPLNRWYRYPAARALLPILGGLPLTPNHVTYIHTAMALFAAYLAYVGGRREWVIAFFLLEARMILDCYDGVLARAKKLSSPYGRAIDEIGDTLGFIALMIAITVRMYREHHTSLVVWLTCGVLAFGGLCANAWDFYKRKVSFALRDGRDGVADELAEKKAAIANKTGGALAYWGVYFDRFQVWLYDRPASVRQDPGVEHVVDTIRGRARRTPWVRRFAKLVSVVSWDNGLFIVHLGLLTGAVLEIEIFAFGWAVLLWSIAIVSGRSLLRPRTQENAS